MVALSFSGLDPDGLQSLPNFKRSFRQLFSRSRRRNPQNGTFIISTSADHVADGDNIPGQLIYPVTSPALSSVPLKPHLVDDIDKGHDATIVTASLLTPFHRQEDSKLLIPSGVITSSARSIFEAPPTSHPRPSFISRVVLNLVPCVNPFGSPRRIPDSEILQKNDVLALKEILTNKHVDTSSREESVDAESCLLPQNGDATTEMALPVVVSIVFAGADAIVSFPLPQTIRVLSTEETDGATSGAVQPPGSLGDAVARTHTMGSEDSASIIDIEIHSHNELEEEEKLVRNEGSGIPISPEGTSRPLLPPISSAHVGRKCLILDLDETLVHSSFKLQALQQADFIVPVEIEYHWHHFHVLKRPGVDNFLKKMGELYEVVVFTASLSKYADPVLDKLDMHNSVAHRLFRESCYSHRGNYVKDLSQLGRPMSDTIILDNSPASYIFHRNNAVPVSSWFNDPHDAELTDLTPFLADLTSVSDVRSILNGTR